MKKLKSNNHAYTLVEMIVVLSVIAIMIGTTGVGISLANSRDAEQGGRAVDVAIANARLGAMSRTSPHEVQIKAATREINVNITGTTAAPVWGPASSPAIPSRTNVRIEIPGITNVTEVIIYFNRATGRVQKLDVTAGGSVTTYTAGSASFPNTVRIHVTNDRNTKRATVVLVTNTGRQYMEYGA
jgi:prepilin-type N-terminal cleavage/methylation domain-containing protein